MAEQSSKILASEEKATSTTTVRGYDCTVTILFATISFNTPSSLLELILPDNCFT